MNCRGQRAVFRITLLGIVYFWWLLLPLSGQGAEVEPDETGKTAPQITSAEHPKSYLDFAVAGGYLMIPIGVCSVLWLAFLVERLITTRRGRVLPARLWRALQDLPARGTADSGGIAEASALCEAYPSSAGRILRAALEKIRRPLSEIEQAVNNTAQREIHSLKRYVRLFAVLAAVTPLIGLLGTVTGMIQAFREVAIQGLGSGQALAPGIYKALVTTAAGLLVAIPALITYHWLMSRVDNFVHELDNLVTDFVEVHKPRRDTAAQPEPTTSEAI